MTNAKHNFNKAPLFKIEDVARVGRSALPVVGEYACLKVDQLPTKVDIGIRYAISGEPNESKPALPPKVFQYIDYLGAAHQLAEMTRALRQNMAENGYDMDAIDAQLQPTKDKMTESVKASLEKAKQIQARMISLEAQLSGFPQTEDVDGFPNFS